MRLVRAVPWLAVAIAGLPVTAGRDVLALRPVVLELPGAPAKVVATDLDDDGRRDLLVVVAYAEIEEIGEDRIENLVQTTTVIPALRDRREIRGYLAAGDGGYRALPPLAIPTSVLHLERAPGGRGAIALTDDGLDLVRLVRGDAGDALEIVPWIAEPPLLRGTAAFQPALSLVRDVDGDGLGDVLIPTERGPVVYLGTPAGIAREASGTLPGLGPDPGPEGSAREFPWPRAGDLDGDGRPDLVFRVRNGGEPRFRALRNAGGARFVPFPDSALELPPAADAEPGSGPRIPDAVVDVDGDGRAEAVYADERERPGNGLRKELKDAKRPIEHWAFHRLRDDLEVDPAAYFEMDAIGHDLLGAEGLPFATDALADLDGDGRRDLVTITLDFSLLQAVRVLATKKISIGVDFHVFCQGDDGGFREVPGLDLSEKLKLDLNDLRFSRFGQFAGDFDGDGRRDFVHLGRGRRLTVHRGREGCAYPRDPDLVLDLDAEIDDLALVAIEDLDGDGRSDIRIVRPLPSTDPDVPPPARLELFLTGTAR